VTGAGEAHEEDVVDGESTTAPGHARVASRRRVLDVSYAEHDAAKAVGARYDGAVWYAPPGTDLERLRKWLPTSEREKELEEKSAAHRALARKCRALNVQGIRPETHSGAAFRGTWEDRGGEVRFSRAHAGHRLWASNVPRVVARVVLVERPVDAMSYHQLDRSQGQRGRGGEARDGSLYLAVGTGTCSLTMEQTAFIRATVTQRERRPTVELAFSNSPEGTALTNAVRQALADAGVRIERRWPTHGRWWNDAVLFKERDYIHLQGGRLPPQGPARTR
jgi:hypothetical protein